MRLDDVTEMAVVIPISIHAPRERCDAAEDVEPAPPLISIHAPRERCDAFVATAITRGYHFNPRTA